MTHQTGTTFKLYEDGYQGSKIKWRIWTNGRGRLQNLISTSIFGSGGIQRDWVNQGIFIKDDSTCETKYLPSPGERLPSYAQQYQPNLCALVFKTIHDSHRGPLTFLRVYSGSLKSHSTAFNLSQEMTEPIQRVYQPLADDMIEVPSMAAGNIAVAMGLKTAKTGDTIVESPAVAHAVAERNLDSSGVSVKPLLAGIRSPEPVFFCSIEPPSVRQQQEFEAALEALQREDPSLRVRLDPETQQTVLEGMGELHIQIVKDRLLTEYKLDVFLGPLFVNYREGISEAATASSTVDEILNNKRQRVTIKLTVIPSPGSGRFHKLEIPHKQGEGSSENVSSFVAQAIENGCRAACQSGPLLSQPVFDVAIRLDMVEIERGTASTVIVSCAMQCVAKALKTASVHLLEPIVRLEIRTEADHSQGLLGDLHRRRAHIDDVSTYKDASSDIQRTVIHATSPLAELTGYSSALRSLTSGLGSLHMEPVGYRPMNSQEQNAVLEKLTL